MAHGARISSLNKSSQALRILHCEMGAGKRKLLTIIKRVLQGARSKRFSISTIIGPVLMVVMLCCQASLQNEDARRRASPSWINRRNVRARARESAARPRENDGNEQKLGTASGASQLEGALQIGTSRSKGNHSTGKLSERPRRKNGSDRTCLRRVSGRASTEYSDALGRT